MELQRLCTLCVVLCLVLVNSAPVHYLTLPASTYPLTHQQQQFYYMPNALTRMAPVPSSQQSETPIKYMTVSHPQASADQKYVITPFNSLPGFLPFARSQVSGFGPQGYHNNQYYVYPAGTEYLRQRPTVWETITGFFGNLPNLPIFNRPNKEPENPPIDNSPTSPLFPLSEGVSGEIPTPEETDELDNVNPDDAVAPAAPVPSAETAPAAPSAETAPAAPSAETAENPQSPPEVPAETPDSQMVEKPETPAMESNAEMASESRLFARSRALPGRAGEGEAEEGVGEQEEEEEEVKEEEEEEEEEDDSVVIGPGSANPSVAQAKPAAIALAGMGGVAAAAPTATAVVGANGLAVAAPSATAIAGPSAGSAPPGLLPKGTKVKHVRVSPEEARINAAKIQAARQQAYDAVTGFRLAGLQYPFLGYQV